MKEKLKRILLLTYGSKTHASSRIRAMQYIPMIENILNISCEVLSRVPERKRIIKFNILFSILKRWYYIKRFFYLYFGKFNILYIQRWFIPIYLLKRVKKKNIKIIYDFDDAIYLNTSTCKTNLSRTLQMLRYSDKVIVSCPVLYDFCKSYNVQAEIITTPVDVMKIDVKKNFSRDKSFIIGWIGSSSTTQYLKIICEPLTIMQKKGYDFRLLLIGASRTFLPVDFPVELIDWSIENENLFLNEIDVGIMPLAYSDWTIGKGGYKLFLYMASGVPVIASPVGINNDIVENGKNGYLAKSTDDWLKYLELFYNNSELCKEFGMYGREQVLKKYDRIVCFEKLKKIIINCI